MKYFVHTMVVVLLMVLASVGTQLVQGLLDTPVPPPSELTLDLVASLEAGDGWCISKNRSESSEIVHGHSLVRVGKFIGFFYIDATKEDFTVADRDRIHAAYLTAWDRVRERENLALRKRLQEAFPGANTMPVTKVDPEPRPAIKIRQVP